MLPSPTSGKDLLSLLITMCAVICCCYETNFVNISRKHRSSLIILKCQTPSFINFPCKRQGKCWLWQFAADDRHLSPLNGIIRQFGVLCLKNVNVYANVRSIIEYSDIKIWFSFRSQKLNKLNIFTITSQFWSLN